MGVLRALPAYVSLLQADLENPSPQVHMPRTPPSTHASDSEDSAPEVLTLSSAKKASRTRAEAAHAFEAEQRQKRRRANRERDAAARAAKAARGGEVKQAKRTRERSGGAGEVGSAEARMERAMREAAEEEGGVADEEWSGLALDIEAAPSKHLPEHLFSAPAASPQAAAAPHTKEKQRKKSRVKTKDIIVGCAAPALLRCRRADLNPALQIPHAPYRPSRRAHGLPHAPSGTREEIPGARFAPATGGWGG